MFLLMLNETTCYDYVAGQDGNFSSQMIISYATMQQRGCHFKCAAHKVLVVAIRAMHVTLWAIIIARRHQLVYRFRFNGDLLKYALKLQLYKVERETQLYRRSTHMYNKEFVLHRIVLHRPFMAFQFSCRCYSAQF